MTKISFKDDYSEGAHPNILQALNKTNLVQENGYGMDAYCEKAIKLIRAKIDNSNIDIHFISAGTQANLIVLSSALKPYESVISADTAYIAVYGGPIEATGHKINTVLTENRKLTPEDVKSVLDQHSDEHMVKPKIVSISNSTEVGSIYNKKELTGLSDFCKQNDLFLYLDGARLGSALTSEYNDLTLSDIAKLVDAFYIGGTKNGALLGEAIVICNDNIKKDFRYNLKQKGGLLAKGRILGIQFLELFTNDLFFDLGKHANLMATKLSKEISNLGYEFLTQPVSNQIFPIFQNDLIDKLSEKYGFYVWQKIDDKKSAIRLVTSWATKEENVESFVVDLKSQRWE
ncbi:MAG TPA: aminotransferase class I/II-fold pyridoxal phosphate-dependent enzyme [Ignavibacteria bacterium]|nr:aminotransferase class I/II-fold pyridoxal phosphate-dependent enzyme [Ignavibacteria bacterium]